MTLNDRVRETINKYFSEEDGDLVPIAEDNIPPVFWFEGYSAEEIAGSVAHLIMDKQVIGWIPISGQMQVGWLTEKGKNLL